VGRGDAPGKPFSQTRWLDRRDGRRVRLVVHAFPFPAQGQLVGQVGSVETSTDHADGEGASLPDATVRATPDYVARLDGALRLTFLNPAARLRLGLRSDAPTEGINLSGSARQAKWNDFRDTVIAPSRSAACGFGDASMRGARNDAVPVSVMALATRTPGGDIAGTTLIARDMSDEAHQPNRASPQ